MHREAIGQGADMRAVMLGTVLKPEDRGLALPLCLCCKAGRLVRIRDRLDQIDVKGDRGHAARIDAGSNVCLNAPEIILAQAVHGAARPDNCENLIVRCGAVLCDQMFVLTARAPDRALIARPCDGLIQIFLHKLRPVAPKA